jgi:DNA-binding MarR family transcriptional regulator
MTKPAELTAHIGYWMRQVSNHVSRAFADKLAAKGFTVVEWVLLRVLYGRDPLPPSRVASEMGVTRGGITKLADRLIARGLVMRASDPSDGRAQTLALTAKAARVVPELAKLADENEAECFGRLSARDRRELQRILAETVAKLGLTVIPVD